jgi:hypothetical protein
VSITITKEERDALYDRIVVRLSGIDGVYGAVEDEDWAAAQGLGKEFSALLRLVCEDLGWGVGEEETLTLSTPPDVLTHAADSLREMAKRDRMHYEDESKSAEVEANKARYLEQTCERLLGVEGEGVEA